MAGQACVHCGADCGKHPVIWDEKSFCCHGCKTVYQILHEKDMGDYYKIQPMSGIRVETESHSNKFAFLDNEELKAQLLDFTDGNISKVKFFVPSIHCASCIWLLEHLDSLNPAISYSTVNFPQKEVYITFRNDQISLRQLAELLAAIHYIPEITLDHLEKKGSITSNRSLLLKIGIAAFSFMNIMLYSFPEYLPGGDLLEQDFKDVFGWLSFILILPVVFYSANDYFLTAYKGLKHRIISIDIPITLGIMALFFESSYAVFSGNGIGYMDSLAGLVFFLLVGKWYQGKTYEALSFERDYKSYFPVAITRLTVEGEEVIPIKNLRKGDHILVRNQELVPADARLIKGRGNIDYAFVTGESIPVPKQKDDFIYAGGRQLGSSVELEVVNEVEQSYLTQLWNQKDTRQTTNSLDNHINKISQYFTLAVLLIALTAFAFWAFRDINTAIYVFTSVLIIACPCALALTIPFTFGNTMRVFGRKGFYLKKTDVIEQLHKTTTIVFDKTGTLTLSRKMTVGFEGNKLLPDQLDKVKSMVRHSSHPLSAALYEHLKAEPRYEVEHYEEIPGMGITGIIEKERINLGSHQFVMGEEKQSDSSGSRVYLSISGKQYGYFIIKNVYREGLEIVINDLKSQYDLHLLSGDNEAEKKNLQKIFGSDAILKFNQSPTDKKAYVEALQKSGKNVLMIGDGLNDAGALAASNTGISIADDVFSFSPACDAILESSKFAQLNQFIRFTRTSFRIVSLSFVISFLYNIIGLSFAVLSILSPLVAAILMPASSVSVVLFATLSVRWMATRKLQ
jgi:Cu+-exporting ATPase